RRFERVVRLDLSPEPDPWVRELLVRHFALSGEDIYVMATDINFNRLAEIVSLGIPPLSYDRWTPLVLAALAADGADMVEVIRAGELLVHHPYESFDATVERFVRTAATDPQVVAIKMTVYRVGDETPFVRSLIKAAEAGKQVACLVELHARF